MLRLAREQIRVPLGTVQDGSFSSRNTSEVKAAEAMNVVALFLRRCGQLCLYMCLLELEFMVLVLVIAAPHGLLESHADDRRASDFVRKPTPPKIRWEFSLISDRSHFR